MDRDDFNAHCLKQGLPALDVDQWGILSTTRHGMAIAALPAQAVDDLPMSAELIIRSLSPMARTALTSLGLAFDLQQLLDIAKKEQLRLFAALHKSQSDTVARRYIEALGFAKPVKASVPAPYYSFHVYGSKAALCFSEAQTRTQARATVNIEGALLLSGPTSQFDWQHKIIIQLSPEEMFLVLAVINGKIPQVQFAGHGAQHDKLLEFQRQQANYFVRLVQRGRSPVAVPMPALQALNLTSLLLQQIKHNHPHLTRDDMGAMEDQLVRMHGATGMAQ